jgi:hypothetical protein
MLNIKFEILSTKFETNPNYQNLNDPKGEKQIYINGSCFEHWRIRNLNLFRI